MSDSLVRPIASPTCAITYKNYKAGTPDAKIAASAHVVGILDPLTRPNPKIGRTIGPPTNPSRAIYVNCIRYFLFVLWICINIVLFLLETVNLIYLVYFSKLVSVWSNLGKLYQTFHTWVKDLYKCYGKFDQSDIFW